MKISFSNYAKLASFALKKGKVLEFVDLKIQKDGDKKKRRRKQEYLANEISSEQALKTIFPNKTIDIEIFSELEKHIDIFIESKINEKYPSVNNPYHVKFGLTKNISRMLFYLCRFFQPELVVETGIANGFSSSYFLLGLNHANKGELISIDYLFLPWHTKEKVGLAIPKPLRKRHTIILGKSMPELSKLISKTKSFDIFMHDSSHTYKHMMEEYQMVWPHLKIGGFLLSDDVSQNDAFLDFSDQVGENPIIVRKDDRGHFGIIKKQNNQ